MTVQDYEKQGGFQEELGIIRTIGMSLTSLQEMLPARPYREAEGKALDDLTNALERLRHEIHVTRAL